MDPEIALGRSESFSAHHISIRCEQKNEADPQTNPSLAIIELKLALSQLVLNFEPGETMEPDLEYEEFLGLSEPHGSVKITLREGP